MLNTRKFHNHTHVVILRDDKENETELQSGNFGFCKTWRFHNRHKYYGKGELVINRTQYCLW